MKLSLPASTFERQLLAGFVAGAGTLLMLAGLTWHFSLKGVDATRYVIHSHQVIASIGRVQQLIYRATSEQRGYLITGDPMYLNGYRLARDGLAGEQFLLTQLVSDNASQAARLQHLKVMTADRIARLERNAQQVETQRPWRSAVDVAAGTSIDRLIDGVVADMHEEEQRLLMHRQALEADRSQMTVIGFFALLLLVVLAVPLLYTRIRRAHREKQAMADEARRLVDVIDSTPDLIAMSTPDGKVSYVNQSIRDLLGIGDLPASEIRREQAYTPASLDLIRRVGIPHAIAHGTWSGETVWRTRDGREVPVSQVLVAHRQADGSHMLSTIARDISELKAAERVLSEKNRLIEEASRMKTEFIATMSHELRTPLNAIIGFSCVIRDGLAGSITPTVKEYTNDILASGRHLLALINDILDLSTIESGNMRLEPGMIEGDELAASGIAIMREQALARGIRLLPSISPELKSLWLDPRKTRQIIFNLLSNAVKFTPDGGEVRLGLRQVSRSEVARQPEAEHRRLFPLLAPTHATFLEISVSDTGVGIAAADLYRLFQPFSQLDASRNRSFEGTGLGLVMVRRLVELQAGALMVDSQPGKGSCFTVWLPLREPDLLAATSTARSADQLRPLPHQA